jgi:ABC-type sulfate/molybdate transport systems ATPase subunit
MQMLLVGRALIARPKLLMLDEPSVGLAPNIAEWRRTGRQTPFSMTTCPSDVAGYMRH